MIYSSFFETNHYFNLNFDYYPANCFPITGNSQLPNNFNISDFESLCSTIVNKMGLNNYNVGCNVSSDSSISVSGSSSNCATNYSALFCISLDFDWDEDEYLVNLVQLHAAASVQILWENDYFNWQSVINIQKNANNTL